MLLLLPILLSTFLISTVTPTDTIDITGWARCSDTTRFLKKLQAFRAQLSPPSKDLVINYRPDVNIGTEKNGTKFVTCKKGQLECDLSKYQVCAKKYLKEDPIPTIQCIQGASLELAEQCAKKAKNGNFRANLVKKCATSSESVELLHKEHLSKPENVTWLPWIVINGVRVEAAEKDPKKYLCALESMKGNKACE